MTTTLVSDKSAINARRHQFHGIVVSVSGLKTLSVLVKTVKTHPKYRKQYTISKKYPVHDELGQAKVGDRATFVSCRPLSKTKRWRLLSANSSG